MTRKEAIEILKPEHISESCTAGVYGCPCGTIFYQGRYFYFDNAAPECFHARPSALVDCTKCWNKKLSIEESASLLSAVGEDVVRAYLRKKRNEPVQK